MATTEHQIPPAACRNRYSITHFCLCVRLVSVNLSLQRIDAGLTSTPTIIGFEAVSL